MKPLVVRRVAGHSMEPTFHDGGLVLASGWLSVRDGDVVVVQAGDFDVVKRLRITADGQRLLTGDNTSEHHDMPLEDGMAVVGRVFWPSV